MLEFRRPFGDINLPELSEAQIWQATTKFGKLFDDLFAKHKPESYAIGRHSIETNLELYGENDIMVALYENRKTHPCEDTTQNIAMRFMDEPSSCRYSLCFYRLYSDAVRREDHDSGRKNLADKITDHSDHAKFDLETFEKEQANTELEIEMGLRLAPVGPDEIAGLSTFLMSLVSRRRPSYPQRSANYPPGRLQGIIDSIEDRKYK